MNNATEPKWEIEKASVCEQKVFSSCPNIIYTPENYTDITYEDDQITLTGVDKTSDNLVYMLKDVIVINRSIIVVCEGTYNETAIIIYPLQLQTILFYLICMLSLVLTSVVVFMVFDIVKPSSQC